MDVRLPDGTVIQNVPDNISKADLTAKLKANGYDISKLEAPQAPQQPAPQAQPGAQGGPQAGQQAPEGAAPAQAPTAQPRTVTNVPEPQERRDVVAGMSAPERFAAGMGKGFMDIGRGIAQRAGDVYELAGAKRPGWAPTESDVEEQRKLDKPLTETKAGVAGEVAGQIAATLPLLGIPGAATAKGAALTGAGLGATHPTTPDENTMWEMVKGAGLGAAGAKVPTALAHIVSPKAVERAKKALGELTPGQALGGFWKTAEEKATSLPIAGWGISKAQRESIESFNKGVLNKILEPIGGKTDKIGYEGVQQAHNDLKKAYDEVLPKLKIQVDGTFDDDIKALTREAEVNLAEPQLERFMKALGPKDIGRFISPDGKISGENMKAIDTRLGTLIRDFQKGSAEEQLLGRELREAQATLRDLVARQNPEHAEQLTNINRGWARLIRVENAMGKVGSKEGIFTPAQLIGAVKATDDSLRHRAFSHGKALFQDIAEEAEKTIGNKYPDSGTAGRSLFSLAALGAYAAVKPALLAGEAALGAAYATPGVKRALTAAVAKRPEAAKGVAHTLESAAPFAARSAGVAGGFGIGGRETPEETPPTEQPQ